MPGVTILDGGMGRQLEAQGAPFRLPQWSATALIEAPQHVLAAHEAFLSAGAEIVTTNTYALVPPCIGEALFASDAERLADLAGRLAVMARDGAGGRARVAGSLPPVFGSYRPDLYDREAAQALLAPLVSGLAPHADIWLGETMSSIAEAEGIAAALAGDTRPLWLSFTLADEVGEGGVPALRSGEAVAEAVAHAAALGAAAVLFNCSRAEVMAGALEAAVATLRTHGRETRLGVYANAFAPAGDISEDSEIMTGMRADLGPAAYLDFARRWVAGGAEIVGGCCGIGPAHVAALREAFPA